MTISLTCRVTTILGVRKFLKFVLGREQVAKPKPDPSIYLAAAKKLGVAPERYNLLSLLLHTLSSQSENFTACRQILGILGVLGGQTFVKCLR